MYASESKSLGRLRQRPLDFCRRTHKRGIMTLLFFILFYFFYPIYTFFAHIYQPFGGTLPGHILSSGYYRREEGSCWMRCRDDPAWGAEIENPIYLQRNDFCGRQKLSFHRRTWIVARGTVSWSNINWSCSADLFIFSR